MRRIRAAIVLLALLGACTADEPATREPTASQDTSGVGEPSPSPVSTPSVEPGSPNASATTADEPSPTAGVQPAATVTSEAWTALSPAPVPLTEVAGAVLGDALWIAGGFDAEGSPVSTVQVYDPTFAEWQPGPLLPEPVHHAALVGAGDELYLIGGYTGADFAAPTSAVRRFSTATGTWEDGPALPEPRAAGAAAWDGQRVIYAGGVGPDGLAGDVFALEGQELEGKEWEAVGELAEPREHLAAASDGAGRVWFLAGRTGGLDENLATVELVEGGVVSGIGSLPTARGGVAGFYAPEAGACAVGGEGPDGTFAEVECITADGETTVLPPLAEPRHGIAAVVLEGVAYVGLGGPEPGLTVSPTLEALRLDG